MPNNANKKWLKCKVEAEFMSKILKNENFVSTVKIRHDLLVIILVMKIEEQGSYGRIFENSLFFRDCFIGVADEVGPYMTR